MAEKFLEPQNPLKKIDTETGDINYIYPQTTAKQVIMDDDGTRLNTILNENILYLGDAEDGGAEIINADTLGGRPAAYYKPVYNLLDNSDFRNPVNQRGATSGNYSWSYAIDRWMFNGTGFVINANGITIPPNGSIVQRLKAGLTENGDNKIFAVCLGDGTIVSGYGSTTVNNVQIYKSKDDDFCGVRVNNLSAVAITVKWAALYEGEYTAETLPEYMPKGYAHELAECKRYFQRFVNIGLPVLCWGTNADQACVTFSTQTNFVKAPDVTLETPVILMDSTGTGKALSNYSLLNYNANSGSVRVRLKSSDSWTKGSGVYIGTATFSADL